MLIREPDFSQLPSNLDPRVVALLRRCLDKNPKRRWQSIGDLRLELEAIASSPAPIVASVAPAAIAAALWRRALPVAVIALVTAAAAAATTWILKPVPLVTPVQFSIDAPEGATFMTDERALASAAISPDGRTVVFTARDDAGKRMIWSRRIDALVSQPLAGTEGALLPFWSPGTVNSSRSLPTASSEK